ncbi:acyl carrier protein [Kitasatospora sp. NPDC059577]|uniref:acyl carrier protein n=1 Tax=unclassified Kitasatospora TaxID=2633591 RepID=UPI0036A730B4
MTTTQETASETIAEVFAEALGLPAIDWETGFFDLGVDSAMVVRVTTELRAHWPGLRIVDVFSYSTVSSLAAHLTATQPQPAG